jgi:chromosome segregation ATPase
LETNLATKEKEYSDQLAQKNETIQSHEESKESVEASLKEEQSKHTTTQSDLQNANDSIKELEKAKSSLETSMKNQAVDYEAKVKNLNETNSSLEQKLEKIQKGKEELEKIVSSLLQLGRCILFLAETIFYLSSSANSC